MKNLLIAAIILMGALASCDKNPFCTVEPPIQWLPQDCTYQDIAPSLVDSLMDTVVCNGNITIVNRITTNILKPLVVDVTCGYYIDGIVEYYFEGLPMYTIDYSLGNGRASKVSYIVYNPQAPCENVRQGCYFQQPCLGSSGSSQ